MGETKDLPFDPVHSPLHWTSDRHKHTETNTNLHNQPRRGLQGVCMPVAWGFKKRPLTHLSLEPLHCYLTQLLLTHVLL